MLLQKRISLSLLPQNEEKGQLFINMEWNMEKKFDMEWNKKVGMEYGKIVFHSIRCPDVKQESCEYQCQY